MTSKIVSYLFVVLICGYSALMEKALKIRQRSSKQVVDLRLFVYTQNEKNIKSRVTLQDISFGHCKSIYVYTHRINGN